MSQTLESVIDEHGAISLLKPIQLTSARRALVTILGEQPTRDGSELAAGYRAMAQDEARETEALEFAEATIGDTSDETR